MERPKQNFSFVIFLLAIGLLTGLAISQSPPTVSHTLQQILDSTGLRVDSNTNDLIDTQECQLIFNAATAPLAGNDINNPNIQIYHINLPAFCYLGSCNLVVTHLTNVQSFDFTQSPGLGNRWISDISGPTSPTVVLGIPTTYQAGSRAGTGINGDNTPVSIAVLVPSIPSWQIYDDWWGGQPASEPIPIQQLVIAGQGTLQSSIRLFACA